MAHIKTSGFHSADEPVVVLVAGSRPEPPHRPRPSRAPVRASAAAELPAADHQALHARSSHAHEQRAASIVATFPVSAGGSSGGSSTASGMQLAGLIAASEGRMSPPGGSSSMCGGAAPAGQPPRPKVSAARKSLAMPPGRVLGTGSTDLTTLLTEASDRLSTLYVGASANATADAALARKQAARRVSSAAGGSGPAAQRLASSSVSVASVASASSFGSQAVAAYAGGPGQSSPDSRMAPSTTGKCSGT